jgi:TetR/AcrR family transcriptional repressor of nem operon
MDVAGKIREIMGRKRRYYESTIRDAIAEGAIEPGDPAQKTCALVALIDGLVSQTRIMNDPEPLRGLPAMALELLRVKQPAAPAASS